MLHTHAVTTALSLHGEDPPEILLHEAGWSSTIPRKYSTTSKGDSNASINIVREDASLVAGLRTPVLREWLAPTNSQLRRALTATRSVAILEELQLQFPTASRSLA